jgi:DNA-binding XRE family transcriptional regulator
METPVSKTAIAAPPTEQDRLAARQKQIDEFINRPGRAEEINHNYALLKQADREYALRLAMVRHAAQLTQVELAKLMGVGQTAISKMETRPDLLLSTLRAYLAALGGDARLIVDFPDGRDSVELSLKTLPAV